MPTVPEVRRDIPLDQLATARRGVVDIPAHQILDRGEPDEMAGPYLARREHAELDPVMGPCTICGAASRTQLSWAFCRMRSRQPSTT
jgi:hypothetical protein